MTSNYCMHSANIKKEVYCNIYIQTYANFFLLEARERRGGSWGDGGILNGPQEPGGDLREPYEEQL